MDFWLEALMNALSLALGAAGGSLLVWRLTRRELARTKRELQESFERSEMVRELTSVMKSAKQFFDCGRRVLESREARIFFARLTEVLEGFVAGGEGEILPMLEEKS